MIFFYHFQYFLDPRYNIFRRVSRQQTKYAIKIKEYFSEPYTDFSTSNFSCLRVKALQQPRFLSCFQYLFNVFTFLQHKNSIKDKSFVVSLQQFHCFANYQLCHCNRNISLQLLLNLLD